MNLAPSVLYYLVSLSLFFIFNVLLFAILVNDLNKTIHIHTYKTKMFLIYLLPNPTNGMILSFLSTHKLFRIIQIILFQLLSLTLCTAYFYNIMMTAMVYFSSLTKETGNCSGKKSNKNYLVQYYQLRLYYQGYIPRTHPYHYSTIST